MEILAVIIFVVIVFTIAFIAYAYHWMFKKMDKERFWRLTPPIVETRYRAVDLQTILSYSELATFEKYAYPTNTFAENVIRNAEHKQYLIKRQAEKLTDEMLSSGIIEIEDMDARHEPNPFIKHTRLKVKVYKREK